MARTIDVWVIRGATYTGEPDEVVEVCTHKRPCTAFCPSSVRAFNRTAFFRALAPSPVAGVVRRRITVEDAE